MKGGFRVSKFGMRIWKGRFRSFGVSGFGRVGLEVSDLEGWVYKLMLGLGLGLRF